MQLVKRKGDPPLYATLAALLEERIVGGKYAIGDLLPTEYTLAEDHGVSRATVVKALDALVDRGLLIKRQGKGTTVASPPLDRLLSGIGGFSEHFRDLGLTPANQLLSFTADARPDINDMLAAQFSSGTSLVELRRLRLIGGTPVGLQNSFLRQDVATSIGLSREMVEDPRFSLYDRLNASAHRLQTANESLRAMNATEEESALLEAEPRTALIEVVRYSFDRNGQLVEAVQARYLGSWYIYRVDLANSSNTTLAI